MGNLTSIECKKCGHENEPERIFCHNCGEKLTVDGSKPIAKEAKKESPKEIKRRVEKTLKPKKVGQGTSLHFLKTLVATIVWAAVIAALILAALPPDGAKPIPKNPELASAPDLEAALENAASWHLNLAKSFDIPESQLNAYLQNRVRQKKDAPLADYLPLRKCYVNFDSAANQLPAHARCTIVYSILNYPIYIRDFCAFQIANHQLIATSLGGSIGRLQIPPLLSPVLKFAFQPALENLQREREQLNKFQSVEILKESGKEGVVRITTAPAAH